jgi:hypothetical protein
MKHLIIWGISLILSFYNSGYSQVTILHDWTKGIGGDLSDQGRRIVLDGNGNLVVAGYFAGTVDFDPGSGVFNLTTSGRTVFIAKYDQLGNFILAKSIGGTSTIFLNDLTIDPLGNVYITGKFAGVLDIDPGIDVVNLISSSDNIFIAKYDSQINFIYGKNIGGNLNDNGLNIEIDNSYNLYLTGSFADFVDFDSGPGIANLISLGQQDVFLAKYDELGNFLFAKSIGGTSNDISNSICLDNSGNIFITGQFSQTVDFDPGVGTEIKSSSGGSDIFISKYDPLGNFIFVRTIGGLSNEEGNCIKVGNNGNIYLAGNFTGVVDFDPGVNVVNLDGGTNSDIFLVGLNSGGNYLFAKSMGSSLFDLPSDLVLDNSNNIFLAGHFNGDVNFEPSTGISNLPGYGGDDSFWAKFDQVGKYIYVKKIICNNNDRAVGIAVNNNGTVYLTGYFSGTADFDPGPGVFNLTSQPGNADLFISKFNEQFPLSLSQQNLSEVESVVIYPNPFVSGFSIKLKNSLQKIELQLCNSKGDEINRWQYKEVSGLIKVDLEKLQAGIYYLNITINKTQKRSITLRKL